MRALKAVSQRKNLVLSFSSPIKTSGTACGKRCNCVTLANASVICWVLSGDGITYTGLICDGCGVT